MDWVWDFLNVSSEVQATYCANLHTGEGRIVSEVYSLLPGNLRDITAVQAALEAAGFRRDAPTYVLAECVLVYMEPEDSAALVRWLGSYLPAAVFLTYEQVGMYTCAPHPLNLHTRL